MQKKPRQSKRFGFSTAALVAVVALVVIGIVGSSLPAFAEPPSNSSSEQVESHYVKAEGKPSDSGPEPADPDESRSEDGENGSEGSDSHAESEAETGAANSSSDQSGGKYAETDDFDSQNPDAGSSSRFESNFPEPEELEAVEQLHDVKGLAELTKHQCPKNDAVARPFDRGSLGSPCGSSNRGPRAVNGGGSRGLTNRPSSRIDPLCDGVSTSPRPRRRDYADRGFFDSAWRWIKDKAVGGAVGLVLGQSLGARVVGSVIANLVVPSSNSGEPDVERNEDGSVTVTEGDGDVVTYGSDEDLAEHYQSEVLLEYEDENGQWRRYDPADDDRTPSRGTDADDEDDDNSGDGGGEDSTADDSDADANVDGEEEADPPTNDTSNPGDIENVDTGQSIEELCRRRAEQKQRWSKTTDVTAFGDGALPEFECENWVTNPAALSTGRSMLAQTSDSLDDKCRARREPRSLEDVVEAAKDGHTCPADRPCIGDDRPRPGPKQVDRGIVPDLGPSFCDPRVCQRGW